MLSSFVLKKIQLLKTKKEEGNEAFGAGRAAEAVQLYTEALNVFPDAIGINSTLFSNRAAAHMKIRNYQEALDDCNKAIELDETNLKAYRRKATCETALEKFEEAVRTYEKACKLDPENRELKGLLKEAKLELKKSKRKNYYKILDISPNATDDEIRRAYRKMALKWHPDKNSESEEAKKKAEAMFKDIGEAYSVLSDPKKKSRYDAGQDLEEMEGGMSDADVGHIFEMFFGGRHPGGRGSFGYSGNPYGGGPFRGGGGPFGGGGSNYYYDSF
jgi:DnaJ family protein C protein 7